MCIINQMKCYITMKKRLTTLETILLLPITVLAQTEKKPNIILILADDMRGTAIHAIGQENTYTPCLDSLAMESTVFTNAHIMGGTSGAVSMPSRAMLMTGKYLHTLQKQGAVLPTEHTTIGETLQESGYTTFHTGKWHADFASFNRCFNKAKAIYFGGMADHWNVPLFDYHTDGIYRNCRPVVKNPGSSNQVEYLKGEYMYSGKHSVDIFSAVALEYIHQQAETGKPFFLSLAYMSPHDPRTMPEEYKTHYKLEDIKLPPNFLTQHPFDNGELKIRDEVLASIPRDSAEIRRHIYEYYAMVSHVDKRVGEIISTLKKLGIYDNTIIVFAGDNGLALGQHGLMGKQNVYEHSVRVPLIIKETSSGRRHEVRFTDALCYLTDVFPTLCELSGTKIPASVDGLSLVPVLKEDKPVRNHLYYGYRMFQRAISDGIWKLIEYNVKGKRTTQLFNLKQDPYEMENLAKKYKHSKLIKQLRKQMSQACEETYDPIERFWEE